MLTRLQSGSINAVDFTVYFDRPCQQTVAGGPLFVETADAPGYSYRSQLAVHATWIMFAACLPYAILATPLWLLGLFVVVVLAGAVHTARIVTTLGLPKPVAVAAALLLVLNDNTARTLNYGFHVEVLYAWFVPWALDAGLRRRPWSFLVATVCCVMVKEDALLVLAAVAGVLALLDYRRLAPREIVLYTMLPVALSLGSLVIYYGYSCRC